MANWQRTLDLLPEWEQSDNDEITIQQLAAVVSARLRALKPFDSGVGDAINEKRDEIADAFEELSKDEDADIDDFNTIMSELYDWADISLDNRWNGRKVCWVKTF